MGAVLLVQRFFTDVIAFFIFSANTFRALRRGVQFPRVIDQMYAIGVRSLSTTLTAGIFVGAIMAIQINSELRDFGAQGFLGGLATSVTIRNVGPVLIAFILSGKVGAYTSAELGTMRVTEQIDAIRCLGASPLETIIAPRLIAVVFSSFLLLNVGLVMSIVGGILFASLDLGVNPTLYVHYIPRIVSWWSVGTGVFKSFAFGMIIALISCYRGYTASGGAEGVGNTVRKTTVETLVCIVLVDFVISNLSALLYDAVGMGLP
jgi:phospholipid/cholesterol/gamma-HCH transport system permease protein